MGWHVARAQAREWEAYSLLLPIPTAVAEQCPWSSEPATPRLSGLLYLVSLPECWHCLPLALVPPREPLEGGARLALAQRTGRPPVLGQGQDVAAFVTHHLQHSLQQSGCFRRERTQPNAPPLQACAPGPPARRLLGLRAEEQSLLS